VKSGEGVGSQRGRAVKMSCVGTCGTFSSVEHPKLNDDMHWRSDGYLAEELLMEIKERQKQR